MTNIDDVAQTLAEYERLAITSGAKVQIDPPEFSADGASWSPMWLAEEPPAAARGTVHRDGVTTTVYAAWDESLPTETAQAEDGRLWRDIWLKKPMQRFGSFIVRKALSRAFREVIGDRIEPDEDAPRITPEPAAIVDWGHLISIAATVDVLDDHWAQMRVVRARTAQLEVAYRERRAQLVAAGWEPSSAVVWEQTLATELTPDELARHHAFFGHARPEPQDHQPPANRAARRASARKRGRR